MPRLVRGLAGVASLAVLLTACAGNGGETGGAAASCADVLRYDGHTYLGHGGLARDPSPAGRIGTGTRPGCDDGAGAVPDQTVAVVRLADVPVGRAVQAGDSVYVRKDRPLPTQLRRLMTAPTCATHGTFRVRGDWLDVQTTRRVRFDGDIRPPYRVSVHITDGPREYLASTIRIRATTSTRPGLGPEDVRSSLWHGGGLVARVRCDGGHFAAESLTSTPG